MNKYAHISFLRKLASQAGMLAAGGPDAPAFVRWQREVVAVVQQIFGPGAVPSLECAHLVQKIMNHRHDDSETVKSSFPTLLQEVVGYLETLVAELELEVAADLPPEKYATPVVKILLLTADPSDTSRLRLGEEMREIQEKIQLAKLRERFDLQQRMSVRPADISQAMLDLQPQIVHFSGHGYADGRLCFEDQMGTAHPVQADALAALFEQFADQVYCVVLNACYSEVQANAIAKHIDSVIGMNHAIGDSAAIAFAIGFYQALGAGRTVEEAYKLGCVQIRLQGIPEHLTPVLVKKVATQP